MPVTVIGACCEIFYSYRWSQAHWWPFSLLPGPRTMAPLQPFSMVEWLMVTRNPASGYNYQQGRALPPKIRVVSPQTVPRMHLYCRFSQPRRLSVVLNYKTWQPRYHFIPISYVAYRAVTCSRQKIQQLLRNCHYDTINCL